MGEPGGKEDNEVVRRLPLATMKLNGLVGAEQLGGCQAVGKVPSDEEGVKLQEERWLAGKYRVAAPTT